VAKPNPVLHNILYGKYVDDYVVAAPLAATIENVVVDNHQIELTWEQAVVPVYV